MNVNYILFLKEYEFELYSFKRIQMNNQILFDLLFEKQRGFTIVLLFISLIILPNIECIIVCTVIKQYSFYNINKSKNM